MRRASDGAKSVSDRLRGVSDDQRLHDLLDDLEGQASALYASDRDAEVADRSRAEYASVTLASRLMASLGTEVTLEVSGAGRVAGRLSRVGTGWCLLEAESGEWLVPTDAVVAATGVSERSVPEVAWRSVSRLGRGSALRRLADEAAACVVLLRSGSRLEVVLRRVGADFVEADTVSDPPLRTVVAVAAVGAVRRRA